jgi:hypothetical protein
MIAPTKLQSRCEIRGGDSSLRIKKPIYASLSGDRRVYQLAGCDDGPAD